MQAKAFYFLDDAAELISAETNLPYTNDDLISKAVEKKLFLFISTSNWKVKVFNTNTVLEFTGHVPIDTELLTATIKNFREGKNQTYSPGFLVESHLLLRYAIHNSEDYTLLQPIEVKSCPFTKFDFVIRHDDLLDFIATISASITTDTDSNDLPTTPVQPTVQHNIFQKNAQGTWTIKFADLNEVTMVNYLGFSYIQHLLMNPNQIVNTATLSTIFSSSEISNDQPQLGQMIEEDLTESSNIGNYEKNIDETALQQYKQEIKALQEKRAEALSLGNIESATKSESEIDFILAEINKNTNRHGKLKSHNKSAKRINDAVGRNIKNAITKLQKSYPELAAHLKISISKGKNCSYAPKENMNWTFD